MNDVTQILAAIEQGDSRAAGQLLPLVYDELRKLAAQRLARENPGQTLQATALVHEAYLRLDSAGLTVREAAKVLGIATSTADRHWAYARAWLYREVGPEGEP